MLKGDIIIIAQGVINFTCVSVYVWTYQIDLKTVEDRSVITIANPEFMRKFCDNDNDNDNDNEYDEI